MFKMLSIMFGLFLAISSYPLLASTTDTYEYPVRPGTSEWEKLQDHGEMIMVTQVPQNVITSISTEGLIETCLDYPLFLDVLAYNELQRGFENVVFNFNGLQELLKRDDAGSKLLEKYRRMNPNKIEKAWTLEQKGAYATEFLKIEILLAQDPILSSMTESERKDLVSEGMKKFSDYQKNMEVYSSLDLERSALLLGRILQKERVESFCKDIQNDGTFQEFLKTGNLSEEKINEILNKVILEAEKFLAQEK